MKELERALTGDSAHTPPARILESLDQILVHRLIPSAPHTIYQELWHIVFWQQMTLDWITGTETPQIPNEQTFADDLQTAAESWDQLRHRFFATLDQAAAAANNQPSLERPVGCPSPSGKPTRIMSIREQLESLAAHNAYHFGRIVLLRQLLNAWPPPNSFTG